MLQGRNRNEGREGCEFDPCCTGKIEIKARRKVVSLNRAGWARKKKREPLPGHENEKKKGFTKKKAASDHEKQSPEKYLVTAGPYDLHYQFIHFALFID